MKFRIALCRTIALAIFLVVLFSGHNPSTNSWAAGNADTTIYLPIVAKPPPPSMLNVPTVMQQCDQWCWAGVSQMILAYYGTSVAQCDTANYAWGRSDCCPVNCGNAICNAPNYMYGPPGSLQGILYHWGVGSTGIASTLSYASVKQEIQNTFPIIIRVGWTDGSGGHFLIIRGYSTIGTQNLVTYNDPADGGSYTMLYDWVVSSYDHTWTHTLYNVHP